MIRQGRRRHPQRLVRRRPLRQLRPDQLRGHEGRRHQHDADLGARAGALRHPRQRRRARLRRDRDPAGDAAEGPRGDGRAHAARPDGRAARHRQRLRLARLRPGELRPRHRALGRRRPRHRAPNGATQMARYARIVATGRYRPADRGHQRRPARALRGAASPSSSTRWRSRAASGRAGTRPRTGPRRTSRCRRRGRRSSAPGCRPEDIDLIILGTDSPDYITPGDVGRPAAQARREERRHVRRRLRLRVVPDRPSRRRRASSRRTRRSAPCSSSASTGCTSSPTRTTR